MAINQLRPRFKPGQQPPAIAKTAVLAGHFVKVVDDKDTDGNYQVGHCGAGELAVGVSEYDSDATNGNRVALIRPPAIARVKPGAALSAGDMVASDATGQAVVAAAGDAILGQVMADAAANDDFAEVALLFSPVPVA